MRVIPTAECKEEIVWADREDIVESDINAGTYMIVVAEGLKDASGRKLIDESVDTLGENPLAGMRGTMLAGFSMVGGAILVALGGPWYLAAAMFLFAGIVALRRGE